MNVLGYWGYEVGGGESGYITSHPLTLMFTMREVKVRCSPGMIAPMASERYSSISRFFSGEPASELPERWQWTYPIVFSPLDPKILYTCSQHVWKTTDDGQSWEQISPDLTYADPETLGVSGGSLPRDMNGPEIYATVFALTPSFHDINTIWRDRTMENTDHSQRR